MGVLADLDRPLLREPGRPLLPWVGAVMVALALAGSAAFLYYSPLTVSALSCPDQGELVPPEETERGASGGPVCLLPHRPGEQVLFTTTIRNDGPLPVSVHGVAFEGAVGELLVVAEVRSASNAATGSEGLRLDGDSDLEVAIAVTMEPCETQRSGRVLPLRELSVRASLLGIGKTVEVPLPEELALLVEEC